MTFVYKKNFPASKDHLEKIVKSQSFRGPLVYNCAISIMAGTFGFQNVMTPISLHTKLSNPFKALFASFLCYYYQLLSESCCSTETTIIFIYKKSNICNDKECSNYCTIALISYTGKVMLKILQASLQQYVNHELLDVQAGFRKGWT